MDKAEAARVFILYGVRYMEPKETELFVPDPAEPETPSVGEDGPGEGLGPEGKAETEAGQLGLRKLHQGIPTSRECGCIPGRR